MIDLSQLLRRKRAPGEAAPSEPEISVEPEAGSETVSESGALSQAAEAGPSAIKAALVKAPVIDHPFKFSAGNFSIRSTPSAEDAAPEAPPPGCVDLRAPDCVVIGPTGAGKSTLLASLHRHGGMIHAYPEALSVEIADPNEGLPLADIPARRSRQTPALPAVAEDAPWSPAPETEPEPPHWAASRFADYAAGLPRSLTAGAAPRADADLAAAEFELTLRALGDARPANRPSRLGSARCVAVDAPGALLERAQTLGAAAASADTQDAAAALAAGLAAAPNVVLCLGLRDSQPDLDAQAALRNRLRRLADPEASAASRLMVVFTKYERLFQDDGRRAYRRAAAPQTAFDTVHAALNGPWRWLVEPLIDFNDHPGRAVALQPASAYGFIPDHGGANLDPSGFGLRTRAPGPEADALIPPLESPYALKAVRTHFWRPFLTADPFVYFAVDAPGGLTFALEEALSA